MSGLRGITKARARARQRPDILDQKVVAAISDTVDEVHQAGRANIDSMVKRRSGLLRRNYKKSVQKSRVTGKVGLFGESADKKKGIGGKPAVVYGRFIHDGTKFISARPFHQLAVARVDVAHARRMRRALGSTIRVRK